MKRLVGLCAACLMAVGCGGGGGGGAATVSDFCNSYNAAVDSVLERCLKVPKDAISSLYGATDTQLCANMVAAVASKRATYDATAGKKCLDQINNMACTAIGTFGGASNTCLQALAGQVADGGSCYADMDCKSGSYCNGVGGGSCPGSCAAYAAKNGDCSQGQICDQGLRCDGSVCQPNPVQGDTCGGTSGVYCPAGLYCSGANGASGTCQTQKAPGASCSGPDQCLEGYACMNGKCAALLGLGKTCSQDADCGVYTYCSSGTCTEDPKTGGTCGVHNSQSFIQCISSWCKITNQSTYTGVCTAYLSPGDTCSTTDYQSCGTGTCDGSTSKCVAACMEPSS